MREAWNELRLGILLGMGVLIVAATLALYGPDGGFETFMAGVKVLLLTAHVLVFVVLLAATAGEDEDY